MSDKTALRPFHVNFPEAELTELRRRIVATRFPEKETVADFSQGVPLATIQKLARYWAAEYDWRKVEARLNAVPNFLTEIDGLDIHFIHVRSKHENALPVIITHGWPGSIVEQLKLIEPLTNPTAHGGTAADAFHVVIPSIPGYGFSGKPTATGWGPERIARAWGVLMKRLGYTSYVAQGGDWGAIVVELMGVQAPKGLLAIHTNMPSVIPPAIDAAAFAGAPVPAGLSADEKHAYEQVAAFYKNVYYAFFMGTRPQTLTALADSPVGLATFMLDHDARSLRADLALLRRRQPKVSRATTCSTTSPVLADEHWRFRGATLLGEQGRLLHAKGREDPRGCERLPGRTLPGAEELGGAGLSQAHPLQQASQGRPFRRLGAAEVPLGRTSRRFQVAARVRSSRKLHG